MNNARGADRKTYFVSAPRNTHVDRFDRLFARSFSNYEFVEISSHDLSEASWTDDFRSKVEPEARVISGPLDSVSAALGPAGQSNIGISYAVDLMVACKDPKQFKLCARYAAKADLLVVDTAAAANILAGMGVPSSRVFVGPWGVDEGFLGGLKKNRFPDLRKSRKILFPRSLEEHYRPHLALEAFARFVHAGGVATLDFVGNGSLRVSLEEQVASYGLDSVVNFRDAVGEENMSSLLADYDAILSIPVTDGTSVTLLQAMAMGIPVIASRTAGAMEWIVDGITGFLLGGDSVEQVLEGLQRFVSVGPAEVNHMRTNSQNVISERANWGVVSGHLISEIQRVSGDSIAPDGGSN